MTYKKKTATLPTPPEDRLYSPLQAAEYLGVAPQTLAHWRVQGRGPKFILVTPRTLRYSERMLREFLERRTLNATCQPLPDSRNGE